MSRSGKRLGNEKIHRGSGRVPFRKQTDYLLALYGRVRQVASEAELRRTPQGLMQRGLGSR